MVAVDVAADPASRVVKRLVLVQPHLPFFEFPEPALDEGLRLGVAVAAAAVADAETAECLSEAAGGEGRAFVATVRQLLLLARDHRRVAIDQGVRIGVVTQCTAAPC